MRDFTPEYTLEMQMDNQRSPLIQIFYDTDITWWINVAQTRTEKVALLSSIDWERTTVLMMVIPWVFRSDVFQVSQADIDLVLNQTNVN